jgi:hypothetical protein
MLLLYYMETSGGSLSLPDFLLARIFGHTTASYDGGMGVTIVQTDSADLIFAALITGGWTTIVALAGYWFGKKNLDATLASADQNAINALNADHAARLWEKKAQIYVDTLRTLVTRRDMRKAELGKAEQSLEDQAAVDKWLKTIPNPNWHDLEARLLAYAPEMEDAIRKTTVTDDAFWSLLRDAIDPNTGDSRPSQKDVADAKQAAFDADELLRKAMQAELHQKPSQEAVQPVTAEPKEEEKKQLPAPSPAESKEDEDSWPPEFGL